MVVKDMKMSWISVSDLNKAKTFFKDILGLKIHQESPEFQWIEMQTDKGDAMLGLAGPYPHSPLAPGQNAIVTFTVENVQKTAAELAKKGVKLLGEIIEVPGEVKMQLFEDFDGNKFQLVELLRKH
jgi:predicted enzyme related to lactoylglutathione lyase